MRETISSRPMTTGDRPFDIVVFGATSFVGELLCTRLTERHGTDGALRWAIAGRDAERLDAVATSTGADVERIVADALDPAAMAELAARTRLVVSTVGPYARFGSALVAAVVEAGTDYCDLSGEPQWMQRMIDAHGRRAEASGARIVHACGFDSIPSDLGTWFTQRQAIERFGVPCVRIGMRVKAAKGTFSGGTIASGLAVLEELRSDPRLREVLGNPYALAPEGQRSGVKQRSVRRPERDELSGQWIGPFVMAPVNTKIVHRSHALLGRPWGENFRYDEAAMTGGGLSGLFKGGALAGGLAGFMGAASLGPTRALLKRFVLPEPGEGPDREAREAGFYDLRFFGLTADGRTIETKVTGDRDPGYGSTSKMLGEAAVCLSERSREESGGGFLTPATAMGDALIERLVAHAGLEFAVVGACRDP